MNNPSFIIHFRKWYDIKTYRATVEITYHTDNLIRFTIKAGEKELYMEKLLFRKTNQWKIKSASFNLSGKNTKDSATLIINIQNAIDRQLKNMFL